MNTNFKNRLIISKLKTYLNEETIYVKPSELLSVIKCLRYHTNFANTQLLNITAVDFPDENNRFTIVYFFNCPTINTRLRIKVKTNELNPIESVVMYFKSAGWYEREIWDLFGIFFINNSNLRRILNDYGFEGHPFRKDFPLTGYSQVQYDVAKKRLISVDVELAQRNQIFTTI